MKIIEKLVLLFLVSYHLEIPTYTYLFAFYSLQCCLGHLTDQCTFLGTQTWCPKNTFNVFFFQLYFNKKYMEVAVSDFKMHIIISKRLRRQQLEEKNNETKRLMQKKKLFMKVFSFI